MARVGIQVLGPLRVHLDGREVTDRLPGQLRPLLTPLAVARGPVDKQRLARDVLYLAPTTLDSRLSRLRAALGLDRPLHRVPVPRSGLIELDRTVAAVDADTLLALEGEDDLTLETLLGADDLWHGIPAPELARPRPGTTCPVGAAVLALLDQRRRCCELAARRLLDDPTDDPRGARDRLARWTREHPDADVVWFARVVRALDDDSQTEASQVLAAWEGANPHDPHGTRAWASGLVRSAPERPPRDEKRPAPTAAPVGRRLTLSRVTDLLDQMGTDPGGYLLVQGAAGTGKTHLLEVVDALAVARGCAVLRVDVEEELGMHAVLQRLLQPVWIAIRRTPEAPSALVRRATAIDALLIPHDRTATPPEPVDPVEHAADLAVELLTHAASTRPMLVAIDNLHRGDAALRRFATTLTRAAIPGVAVLLTSRSPLAIDGATDSEHVLLGELTPDDARLLIREARGIELGPDDVRRLISRVGGTPLALLAADLDDGGHDALVYDEGPMRAYLRALDAPVRRALAVAAVCTHGTTWDVRLLAELEPGACDLLDRELDRGRAVHRSADGPAFTHRSWQEVAYLTLDPYDRRQLHARAVEALDRRLDAESSPEALRATALLLAVQARNADLAAMARATALRSLQRSADMLALVDVGHAIGLLDLALAIADERASAALLLRRAQLHRQSASWAAAERDYLAAFRIAEAADDPLTASDALLGAAQVTWAPTPAEGRLAADLERVLRALPMEETVQRARVEACLAGGLYQDGTTGSERDALGLAERALAALDRLETPPAPATEAEVLWWARKGMLDVAPPERVAAISARMSELDTGSSHHHANALLASLVDRLLLGDVTRARRTSAEYQALAAETDAPLHRYVGATLDGLWHLYDGNLDLVERAADSAADIGSRFGGITVTQVVEGQRVCAARDRGHFRAQPELLALVEALTPVDGPIPIWTAAVAWLEGDVGASESCAARVREIRRAVDPGTVHPGPHRPPFLAFVAEALFELWHRAPRLLDASMLDLAARLRQALREHPARGILLGWPVAYLGAKARYLGLLAAVLGEHPVAREQLLQARRADGARTPLGARNLLALALVNTADGSNALAARQAAACRRDAERLGMPGVAEDASRCSAAAH